jgi:hypothetical protein
MMTEKGTARPRKRGLVGSTIRRKKLAARRVVRALKAAGFIVGRKLVIDGSGRAVAIAFPNYIRPEGGHFRMPDEAGIADVFALIALHFAETSF